MKVKTSGIALLQLLARTPLQVEESVYLIAPPTMPFLDGCGLSSVGTVGQQESGSSAFWEHFFHSGSSTTPPLGIPSPRAIGASQEETGFWTGTCHSPLCCWMHSLYIQWQILLGKGWEGGEVEYWPDKMHRYTHSVLKYNISYVLYNLDLSTANVVMVQMPSNDGSIII